MSKKTIKIISIIAVILCVMMSMTTCLAAGTSSSEDLDIKNLTGQSSVDVSKIETVGNSIIKVLKNIGFVLAVVMLMILGIKYMMGSAEEKAEYKKTMLPYLIGAVLIFAASFIAQAVVTFSTMSASQ